MLVYIGVFIVGALVGAKLVIWLQGLGMKKLNRDGRLKVSLDGRELKADKE